MSEANKKDVNKQGNNNQNGKADEPKTEKVGFFQKLKNGIKNNKKAIISGLVGFGAGIGTTVGVAEIGKRSMRKHQNACVPVNYDDQPLDPNIE